MSVLGLSLLSSLYAKESGFYVGASIGASQTKDYGVEYDRGTGLKNGYTQTVKNDDLTYGALVGYDLYFDKFLLGLELDVNKKNTEERTSKQVGGVGAWYYRSKVNKVSSLKLRLGYLADDKNLLYISYGRAKADIVGKMYNQTNTTQLGEYNNDLYGNQYSVGIEHFYESNLSLQIDFKTINYKGFSYNASEGVSHRREYHDLSEKALSLAIKYKF